MGPSLWLDERLNPPPGDDETITSLCHGATSAAERIRHAATINPVDATWSPALTADSLRHTATCSTVISHNCEILLRTLATRARQHDSDALASRLLGCADSAGQARMAWLHTARAWYQVTIDSRGTIAPDAAQTGDLALWTGRLAYTDAAWTPALGPSHTTRTPDALAPEPMPAEHRAGGGLRPEGVLHGTASRTDRPGRVPPADDRRGAVSRPERRLGERLVVTPSNYGCWCGQGLPFCLADRSCGSA